MAPYYFHISYTYYLYGEKKPNIVSNSYLQERKLKMKNTIYKMLTDGSKSITKFIDDKILHTISIDSGYYTLGVAFAQVFENFPEIAVVDGGSTTYGCRMKYQPNTMPTNNQTFFTLYKDTPIWLEVRQEVDTYAHKARPMPKFYIKTINNEASINTLKEFLNKCMKYGVKESKKDWTNWKWTHSKFNQNTSFNDVQLRTFDDVFVTEENLNKIKTSLDSFIEKKPWYLSNHIPYHFGIMLHGTPGGGKSSIAQAICDYVGGQLHIINGDDIDILTQVLSGEQCTSNGLDGNGYIVLLIEDIDCGVASLKRNSKNRELMMEYINGAKDPDMMSGEDRGNVLGVDLKKPGLATILNSLDGVCAPTNIIYIFTTNHAEELDPALVRPGRIDLKVEINGICKETFNQFLMRHYGRGLDDDLDNDFEVNENITFAELQTDVMKGMDYGTMIRKVNKNDSRRRRRNRPKKSDK